jgi:hypothetical protein
MTLNGSQSAFLIVVIALSLAFGLDDVGTAQMSQGINCLWTGTFLWLGWRLMNKVPANNQLPEGHSLLTEGFVQVYKTGKNINSEYKRGLRWFFLALIFAEAAANAFIIVAVVFLDEQMGLSGTEIGIFFLTSLLSTIPGACLASRVTERLDPKRSWQWSMAFLTLWAACGALVLDVTPKAVVYPWGAGIGVFLGWYYPTENLFLSMCLPEGQEAVRRTYPSHIIFILLPYLTLFSFFNCIFRSIGIIRLFRLLHTDPRLASPPHIYIHGGSEHQSNVWGNRCHCVLPHCYLAFDVRCTLGRNPGRKLSTWGRPTMEKGC